MSTVASLLHLESCWFSYLPIQSRWVIPTLTVSPSPTPLEGKHTVVKVTARGLGEGCETDDVGEWNGRFERTTERDRGGRNGGW